MTESYDPSEMTDEEADELADEVELRRKRSETKYGDRLNDE
jgi:hypothetical protein